MAGGEIRLFSSTSQWIGQMTFRLKPSTFRVSRTFESIPSVIFAQACSRPKHHAIDHNSFDKNMVMVELLEAVLHYGCRVAVYINT